MTKGFLIFFLSLLFLIMFAVIFSPGPGIALGLSLGLLGWVIYLLFSMGKSLSSLQKPADAKDDHLGKRERTQEYQAIKRALKELELDHFMGKISVADYQNMRNQYRHRATLLLKELDQGPDIQKQIQFDLETRIQSHNARTHEDL